MSGFVVFIRFNATGPRGQHSPGVHDEPGRMNVTSRMMRIAAACLLLVLGGCGGGGGGDEGAGSPPPAQTGVGPAGGTVTGPNGAKVVIPPGALTTTIDIRIEQTSAGSPALPGGFSVSGQMFAFTPHGTTFAVPVTVTLPFSAS